MKTKRNKHGKTNFAAALAILLILTFTLTLASGCAPAYGGDAITDVTSPVTTAAATTEAVSTADPYTLPEPTETAGVHPRYDGMVFTVLRPADGRLADNVFADNTSDYVDMYIARDSVIKSEYGATVASFAVTDINTAMQTGYLSGGSDNFNAVLAPVADVGVRLLIAGLLQDLTEPGIGIGLSSVGVNDSLTHDASFGTGIYLLFTDMLYSDITATSALYYRRNAVPEYTAAITALLGDDPASLALSGDFTLETMLTCISLSAPSDTDGNTEGATGATTGNATGETTGEATGETTGDASGNLLANTGYVAFSVPGLISNFDLTSTVCALGAHMFVTGSDKLPSVGITSDAYRTAYSSALSLINASSPSGLPIFELTRLGAAGYTDGGLYLPLPRAAGERADYCSPVDPSLVCALAVPAGIADGGFTADILLALGEYSADVRAARIADTLPTGDVSEGLAELILGTSHIDGAWLYGWGDVGEFVAEGLAARTDADVLFSDRTLASRVKAVAAAASIVDKRYAN